MNQSSLSVTDVGKSSAALLSARGGSAKQSGEVAESESFLSKLGAIFKSEEKAEKASDAEVKTDQTEDKQSVDGKQPVADAESLENAKSLGNAKSAEAIAELELGDDAAEEATVEMLEGGKQATAEAGKSTSNGKKLDEAAVKMPVSATGTESQKAADAMKSGNELLGRLDESNQALKSPPGKGLPQSDNSLKIDSARVNSSEMDSGVKAKQDVMSKYIQLPETEKPKVDSNTYVDSNNYVEGKPFTQATSEGSVQSQVATGGDADAETKSVLGTEKSLVDSSLSKASSEYEVKSAQTPFDQQIAESVNVNSGVSSGNVSVQEAKINLDPVQPISSRQPGGKVEVAQQASQHSQVGSAGVNVVETEANPQEAQQSALHKFFPQSSGQQNINQQDIRLSEWQPQAGRTEALNQVVQEEAVTPEQIVTPEQMVTPEQIVTPEQKRTKIPVADNLAQIDLQGWNTTQDIHGEIKAANLTRFQQQNPTVMNMDPQQLAALQAEAGEMPMVADGEWHELMPAQQMSGAAELSKQSIDLTNLQSEQSATNHQIRNHQLQQQMVHSQHSAALQQSSIADKQAVAQTAIPTPTAAELNAANLHAVNPAQVHAAQTSNHQGLKAAVSATTASGTVQTMGADKRETKETEFSQQLAGLAGQQGISQTQARAETQQAAATQSPLQLNRDMAGEQLAERVQMMMSKNLKNVDIRLDPPELGRMHIRMTMNNDVASVQFTVSNPQARDMVEQAMPRLREMLSQQGVQLADTSVQQQNSGQQRQYTAGNGSGGNGGNGGHQGQVVDDGLNLDEGINLDVNIATKDDGISYYA